MAIFPDNKHLQITIYVLTSLGLWRLTLEDHPKLKQFYKIYSKCMFSVVISFITTQVIELIVVIIEGNINEVVKNLGLTILYIITAIRVSICKGNICKQLVATILETESKIMRCKDKELKKIYWRNAVYSQGCTIFFVVIGIITTVFYLVEPYLEDNVFQKPLTNQIKTLPISSWLPFNKNEHYTASYIIQSFAGVICASHVVYTDVFLINLIIFPIGQIRLLQHIFRNFQRYKNFNKNLLGDSSALITLRSCILMHKQIIQYVKDLDNSLKFMMLLDFASCSFQMGVVLFQLIMLSNLGAIMICYGFFLVAMIIQMFLFYWHANEIIIESKGVANAIYDSEWYTEDTEIQRLMLVVMVRAQRPLTLSVGPVYAMSADTAIAILKATYSYGALMRQSYNRKN